MILFLAVILLLGLFNPFTGLFGDTLYSPRRKHESEKEIKHKSFKLTKGH